MFHPQISTLCGALKKNASENSDLFCVHVCTLRPEMGIVGGYT